MDERVNVLEQQFRKLSSDMGELREFLQNISDRLEQIESANRESQPYANVSQASVQTNRHAAISADPARTRGAARQRGIGETSLQTENRQQPIGWREQWQALRQQLNQRANQLADETLTKDMETLNSYWRVLVEKWDSLPPPAEDTISWKSNWWLGDIDFHLYQPPQVLSREASVSKLLDKLSEVIQKAQQDRQRQLREQWGFKRIEGIVGKDKVSAHLIEIDSQRPYEPTTDKNVDGTFCCIVPGRGGYRWNGEVLRPTYAVFYRYQPQETSGQ
jgi:hypothetical protein